MSSDRDLAAIRKEIIAIDDQILALVAQRMSIVDEVADYKHARNLPIKDYRVEKSIVDRVSAIATDLGLAPEMSEQIFKILIEYSCRRQERQLKDRQTSVTKNGRPILVVGGLGRMGKWLSDFFSSLGHEITICDQYIEPDLQYPQLSDLPAAALGQEIIILATPMSETAKALQVLTELGTKALVVDICSLKSPIVAEVDKAIAAGIRFSSIHPMFGSGVQTLVGRNVLICQREDFANQELVAIFRQSSANLLEVPFAQHDRLMSYVLGLAHLLNIVNAQLLRNSPFTRDELIAVAGTTFAKQVQVTAEVAAENQDLYFDIQSLNLETATIFDKLEEVVASLRCQILDGKRQDFRRDMQASRDYFA